MIPLWKRSAGYYLIWSGAVYLIGGLWLISSDWREYSGYVAPVWIFVLMLPFAIPPFGRWINMDITWDKDMFDWFKKKEKVEEGKSNVVPFPEPKVVPPMPKVEPPKEEPKIFYRIGVTDKNRVAFSMGYSEITMNKQGCQHMIDQLKVFMDQLNDEEDDGLDSD